MLVPVRSIGTVNNDLYIMRILPATVEPPMTRENVIVWMGIGYGDRL